MSNIHKSALYMEKIEKDSTVFVFPGQGSQAIGMGKDIFEKYHIARDVLEETNEAIGFDIYNIICNEEQKLNQTEYTQVAIMVVSIAILRSFLSDIKKNVSDLCSVVAGHSLGEYTALCAGGSISLTDCAILLKQRGIAMGNTKTNGSMIAVLGSSMENIEQLVQECSKSGILVIANDNCNGQVVLSGTENAIEMAKNISGKMGIKRIVQLPVSGAFHSPLMQSAKEEMSHFINNIKMNPPSVKILQNVSCSYVNDVESIKKNLISQIDGRVRWRESINLLSKDNYKTAIEFGNGQVISGLIKKTSDLLIPTSVSNCKDIENIVKYQS